MGRFIYENAVRVDFDDRFLTHLQIVMREKLRRGEPFHFTWDDDLSLGGGRTSVWVHPGASLTFQFAANDQVAVNPVWLEALMQAASSTGGLHVVPEPDDGDAATDDGAG